MKNILKILTLSLLVVFTLTACGEGSGASSGDSVVTLNGSTSMKNVALALTEAFMEENPDITTNVEFTGSSSGLQAVSNGTSLIGNSSRALKQEELDEGLVENIIAIDGIAVITNNSNSISDLTHEQLIDIFMGNITNWSELGGQNEPIVLIGRESGSGTRDAFEEILDLKDSINYVQEIDSTGAVVAKVTSTPGSIGYVSADVIDNNIKALAINGSFPTNESILNGNYPLSRPFIMATKGSIESQPDSVIRFFEFVSSEEGTKIIESVGLVPVN